MPSPAPIHKNPASVHAHLCQRCAGVGVFQQEPEKNHETEVHKFCSIWSHTRSRSQFLKSKSGVGVEKFRLRTPLTWTLHSIYTIQSRYGHRTRFGADPETGYIFFRFGFKFLEKSGSAFSMYGTTYRYMILYVFTGYTTYRYRMHIKAWQRWAQSWIWTESKIFEANRFGFNFSHSTIFDTDYIPNFPKKLKSGSDS